MKTGTLTMSQVYTDYKKLMYFMARKYLSQPELIEDAIQEMLIKIMKNLDGFSRMSIEKQKNYVMKIAKFTSIDVFNREVARHGNNFPLEDDESLGAVVIKEIEEYDPQKIIGVNVDEYIKNLSDIDREIIICVYGYELEYEEISNRLGISQATARKRLSRAQQHLREEMMKRRETNK